MDISPTVPTPPPRLPRAAELNHALFSFVRDAGRTRALPTTLHLGRPGAGDARASVPHASWYDAALRADLVERALTCLDCAEPFAWLTRTGELVAADCDHEWRAAVLAAAGRLGLRDPDFYVITRRGWLDLRTGERQQWHRVRPARRRSAA